MSDRLRRYLDEQGQIKAFLVESTKIGQDAFQRWQPSPIALQLLTQTMTASLLLAANSKDEGSMRVKIKGDGPLEQLVAEANTNGQVRGYAHPSDLFFEAKNKRHLFEEAIGSGTFEVKRRTMPTNRVFSSVVPLVEGELAMNLSHYLMTSEQVPSAVQLSTRLDPELGVAASAGIMIQALPDTNPNLLYILQDRLMSMPNLSSYFLEEGGFEPLVEEIFEGLSMRLLREDGVIAKCACSKELVFRAISLIALEELVDMRAEEKTQESVCAYCNTTYRIEPADLDVMISLKRNPTATD